VRDTQLSKNLENSSRSQRAVSDASRGRSYQSVGQDDGQEPPERLAVGSSFQTNALSDSFGQLLTAQNRQQVEDRCASEFLGGRGRADLPPTATCPLPPAS